MEEDERTWEEAQVQMELAVRQADVLRRRRRFEPAVATAKRERVIWLLEQALAAIRDYRAYLAAADRPPLRRLK